MAKQRIAALVLSALGVAALYEGTLWVRWGLTDQRGTGASSMLEIGVLFCVLLCAGTAVSLYCAARREALTAREILTLASTGLLISLIGGFEFYVSVIMCAQAAFYGDGEAHRLLWPLRLVLFVNVAVFVACALTLLKKILLVVRSPA
jgi:hypothetical protein